MKSKISPAIVGAFVIGAFALATLALLSFGGLHFFEKPQRFVVYFDESIHGLDLGSAVKLRGVRVGRVTSINIRYDMKANSSVVAVVCELNKDMVTDPTGVILDVANPAELKKLVERGLRAQLGVAGLATGLLFVELDFKDPNEFPLPGIATNERYVVVPSVRSAIAEFQAGLTELLSKLKEVDLAHLAKEVGALVTTTRKQIEGVDLRGLVDQWRTTGAQFEALAKNPEIKQTLVNLNAAIVDVRATLTKLDGQIEPTSKELAATLAEAKRTMQAFSATAASVQGFVASNGAIGQDVAATLTQLGEAAEAVKRLADFLERNPNALITGRKRPE